jgi:hypothetical protein
MLHIQQHHSGSMPQLQAVACALCVFCMQLLSPCCRMPAMHWGCEICALSRRTSACSHIVGAWQLAQQLKWCSHLHHLPSQLVYSSCLRCGNYVLYKTHYRSCFWSHPFTFVPALDFAGAVYAVVWHTRSFALGDNQHCPL